jgi:hypothetical protein
MRIDEIKTPKDTIKNAKIFARWACKRLGIDLPPIKFSADKDRVIKNHTFGTTWSSGEIWVYIDNRNLADILRTLCHELIHVRQFNRGTAHTSMSKKENLEIEDEANALAGRMMREYGKKNPEIFEGKHGSLQPDVAAALPATYAIPELKNQDPYLQYRFGVALAGAKGAKRREEDGVKPFNPESVWGENEIVVSFDPHIEEYIDDALNQMGLKGKRLISTKHSEETRDVGTKSPITGFKGYPR